MRKRLVLVMCTLALVMSQISCGKDNNKDNSEVTDTTSDNLSESTSEIGTIDMICKPYDDLRLEDDSKRVLEEGEFDPKDIYTFSYNDKVILQGSEDIQKQILENAKDPGLGIQSLHDKGYTGKGVNVAIVDQNMLLDHPEFEGKIVDYYDTGCNMPADNGSYHGAAVTSIFVGNTIGVAPDARVYYAAVPSWEKDSAYYAKGIDWILEKNSSLPEDKKIRIISISSAPCGKGTPFVKNIDEYEAAVKRAKEAGILVLDCSDGVDTSLIYPAYYDPEDRENPSKCMGGFPDNPYKIVISKSVCVPCSFRTVAEEYRPGEATYRYDGVGGLSWGIPYAAGVLSLGWQIDPDISNDDIVELLLNTCVNGKDGSRIIDPVAFIKEVENKAKK